MGNKKIRFGYDSKQSLPIEIEQSYHAWDEYMSGVWYRLINSLGIHSKGCLIEIAPGSSIKIGMALNQMSFSGQLYLIEPHPALGQFILKMYQSILPLANIILISETLEDSLLTLPLNPDAILSNHPLDDMLLAANAFKKSKLFDSWANNKNPTPCVIRQEWKKLSSNPTELMSSMEAVISIWKEVNNQLKPNWLLMSQYPSYTLEHENLTDLNQHAAILLDKLRDYYNPLCVSTQVVQKILNSMTHYNHEHIGNYVLNAAYWLVVNSNGL